MQMYYFLRNQQTKVNYSTYTMVISPQDMNEMIYFKASTVFLCDILKCAYK